MQAVIITNGHIRIEAKRSQRLQLHVGGFFVQLGSVVETMRVEACSPNLQFR
jgi:hypothetical protein